MDKTQARQLPLLGCTLTPDAAVDRIDSWDDLCREAKWGRPLADGAELGFPLEVADRLRQLISLEGQCCSFLEFAVAESESQLSVKVTSPRTDAAATLRDLVAQVSSDR